MQRKAKAPQPQPPSLISTVIKAIRPRQTWDDKVVTVVRFNTGKFIVTYFRINLWTLYTGSGNY